MGTPRTHVTWHKVAPAQAAQYTVLVPDLRGYGDSSKPAASDDHSNYSFRAMADDQVEVMRQLGHSHFLLAGTTAARELRTGSASIIPKLVRMDIAPTLTMYNDTSKEFATKYVWLFCRFSRRRCRNTSSASTRCTTCAITS